MLNYKKRIVICFMFLIFALVGFFLLYQISSTSKEEDILKNLMGEYEISELLYRTESVLSSSTFEYERNQAVNKRIAIRSQYITFNQLKPSTRKKSSCVLNPNYRVVKIDNDFMDNGIRSQGSALRGGLISNKDELAKYKDAYAIFIKESAKPDMIPPQVDATVFYYLDGEYYSFSGFSMCKLEKVK